MVAAIESHCSDFMKLHGIRVQLAHRSVPKSIPLEVALCLYRVTQECLNNVAKHSGAREAAVAIEKKEGDVFRIETDKMTLYAKQMGAWAIICVNPAGFANIPADPSAAAADQAKTYDLAFTFYAGNLPSLSVPWRSGSSASLASRFTVTPFQLRASAPASRRTPRRHAHS